MRTIKFRIWDKKYSSFDFNASPELFISTDGEVFEKDERNYGMQTYTEYNRSDFYEISQFTGLKDKNGKPIYEGDIIKIPCDIPDSMHGNYSFHEVVYRNGTWINQYLKSETGFKLPKGYTAGVLIDNYEHQMKNLVFNDGYLTDTEIEVIGNIYENSDLLEQTT